MPRRYKIGANPIYDAEFDRRKGQSAVLNPRSSVINDVALEASFQPAQVLGEWLETAIPKAQAALDAAAREWENLQARARRNGRPVPEVEPPRILERRLKAEALADVTGDEVAALKRLAEQRKKIDAAIRPAKVLPHGPRGCGFGEPLRQIDGQAVVERDGDLVIACPQSQYDGLALPIYHSEVVMPYLKACRKARKETGKAAAPWPPKPEGP